jgi:hypothetical protein
MERKLEAPLSTQCLRAPTACLIETLVNDRVSRMNQAMGSLAPSQGQPLGEFRENQKQRLLSQHPVAKSSPDVEVGQVCWRWWVSTWEF